MAAPHTISMIKLALENDPDVKKTAIDQVVGILSGKNAATANGVPIPINETKAALLLGIERSVLYRWRTGTYRAKSPFPFHTTEKPFKRGVFYDQREIEKYLNNMFPGDPK